MPDVIAIELLSLKMHLEFLGSFCYDPIIRAAELFRMGNAAEELAPRRFFAAVPWFFCMAMSKPGLLSCIIESQKEVIVKAIIIAGGLILATAVSSSAQKLTVKIIDRQDKEEEYNYAAVYNSALLGRTVATGKTFKVHGATFTLQLPDGRLAIVNCESKFAEHMAGRVGNRRSCRTPVVDSIQADFNGGNAKLIWPVSLDGKKTQSETYKVLGILDKPTSN